MTRPMALAASALWLAVAPVLAQPAALDTAGATAAPSSAAGAPSAAAAAPALMLAPTEHPRLPLDLVHLWLAPHREEAPSATTSLTDAVARLKKGSEAEALAILSQASVQEGPLGSYALYYAGVAQQRLGKSTDALRTFRLLLQRAPLGYLRQAAALGEAETLETLGDHAAAAQVYEQLTREQPVALDDVLLRLGRTSEAVGNTERAIEAYQRVYYEFPLGEYAASARARLEIYPSFGRLTTGSERVRLELARAQRLFGAKQYGPAKASYQALTTAVTGDDKDLVELRIAECDYHLRRYLQARSGVAPFTRKGARQAEALYYDALASRALGNNTTYLNDIRTIVDVFPEQTWAADALNHLATQYIRQSDDEAADTVFRELLERFPQSRHAERAAWKVGWRSFRQGRYEETAQIFERAAVQFPRSDYRPAWLFWSGRAHEEGRKPELAEARYRLASLDYLNSYYGRLAVARLDGKTPPPRVISEVPEPISPPPPNGPIVRALLEAALYDDALNELKFIQRSGADSSAVQATIAWIYRQQGLSASGREQFSLFRGSITVMRRAYPQFMAAGGEYLPRDVLSLIFPLSYWDLIQKHATANNLDPYFVAALVAQESTFVPDVRSSANAVGLMQLIPSTARMYARKLGLKYSPRLMTNPEANIRMGTAYLADKVREFGDLHLVLASYNAGERPVRRWLSERPGVPADEFIDDIPYPETQNYVKRILGTADDYRRLYGGLPVQPLRLSTAKEAPELETPIYTGDPDVRLVSTDAVSDVTASTPVKPEVRKPVKRKTTASRKSSRKPAPKSRAAKPARAKGASSSRRTRTPRG
ncbi:MAG: transglycosylase SLT domain-containing protein [Vicinamibacterales bacterium]